MARDVRAFLSRKKLHTSDVEAAQQWAEIEDMYSKRLWHQLTLKLHNFVHHEHFKEGEFLDFYESFLADFEHKINPLSFVDIVLVIIKDIKDPDEAINFLEKTKEKVKNDFEANVLCLTAIGTILLEKNSLDKVKAVIEEAEQVLDTVDSVTTVHSRFYDLCSKFHKVNSDYEAFYINALRYLGCMDVTQISAEEQVDRAFNLGLAALLGENVYNFGELLSHPVLESLRGTKNTWLIKVLHAFNSGDLKKFHELRPFWEEQPDLLNNQENLLKKIRLLSLMEGYNKIVWKTDFELQLVTIRISSNIISMFTPFDDAHLASLIFRRHSHDRTISFEAIATAANVDINEVELLVMKALSRGLVKGSIDEVAREVSMTWVQPRVLNKDQVGTLQQRITEWCKHISNTVHLMKNEVPEVVMHL